MTSAKDPKFVVLQRKSCTCGAIGCRHYTWYTGFSKDIDYASDDYNRVVAFCDTSEEALSIIEKEKNRR